MALQTDISEQKLAEARLRKINSIQSAILNSADLLVISCGVQGMIVSCNKTAESLLAFTSSDYLSKPVLMENLRLELVKWVSTRSQTHTNR